MSLINVYEQNVKKQQPRKCSNVVMYPSTSYPPPFPDISQFRASVTEPPILKMTHKQEILCQTLAMEHIFSAFRYFSWVIRSTSAIPANMSASVIVAKMWGVLDGRLWFYPPRNALCDTVLPAIDHCSYHYYAWGDMAGAEHAIRTGGSHYFATECHFDLKICTCTYRSHMCATFHNISISCVHITQHCHMCSILHKISIGICVQNYAVLPCVPYYTTLAYVCNIPQ